MPWSDPVDVISSDESSSSDADMGVSDGVDGWQLPSNVTVDQPAKEMTPEGIITSLDLDPGLFILVNSLIC